MSKIERKVCGILIAYKNPILFVCKVFCTRKDKHIL